MTLIRPRFRFRLRTLLCLPVLIAVIWWWISWPDRTAHRFVTLLNKGDDAAARSMLFPSSVDADHIVSGPFDIWELATEENATFAGSGIRPRSISDVIGAKGTFGINRADSQDSRYVQFGLFTVVRGRIRRNSNRDLRFVSYRPQSDAAELLKQLKQASYQNASAMLVIEADDRLIIRSTPDGNDEILDLIRTLDLKTHSVDPLSGETN